MKLFLLSKISIIAIINNNISDIVNILVKRIDIIKIMCNNIFIIKGF